MLTLVRGARTAFQKTIRFFIFLALLPNSGRMVSEFPGECVFARERMSCG